MTETISLYLDITCNLPSSMSCVVGVLLFSEGVNSFKLFTVTGPVLCEGAGTRTPGHTPTCVNTGCPHSQVFIPTPRVGSCAFSGHTTPHHTGAYHRVTNIWQDSSDMFLLVSSNWSPCYQLFYSINHPTQVLQMSCHYDVQEATE